MLWSVDERFEFFCVIRKKIPRTSLKCVKREDEASLKNFSSFFFLIKIFFFLCFLFGARLSIIMHFINYATLKILVFHFQEIYKMFFFSVVVGIFVYISRDKFFFTVQCFFVFSFEFMISLAHVDLNIFPLNSKLKNIFDFFFSFILIINSIEWRSAPVYQFFIKKNSDMSFLWDFFFTWWWREKKKFWGNFYSLHFLYPSREEICEDMKRPYFYNNL